MNHTLPTTFCFSPDANILVTLLGFLLFLISEILPHISNQQVHSILQIVLVLLQKGYSQLPNSSISSTENLADPLTEKRHGERRNT